MIVVSHDRHFLDRVCTHIADVDFQKVTLYTGNYTFWYETSQLALRQKQDSNRKKEDQIKELKTFIARFSANASKSRAGQLAQAAARQDHARRHPAFVAQVPVHHVQARARARQGRPQVEHLSKSIEGEPLFHDLRLTVGRGERVAVVGDDRAVSALLGILAGTEKADTVKCAGAARWSWATSRRTTPRSSTPT